MTDSDEFAAALERRGMYDPASPDAPARLRVITELLDRGYTIDQLAAREADVGLANALTELVLWGPGERVPLSEIARRVGLDEDTVRYARRLFGFADPGDEPRCHPDEVHLFAALASAVAFFGEDRPLQFTRVMGMSAAMIAEGAMAMFAEIVRPALSAAGASETQLFATTRGATESYLTLCRAVDVALRMHFEMALALYAGVSTPESEFAVAFVDLVDSTALTIELDAITFAESMRSFDRNAAEAAAAHDVRLVKLLGDGAMLAGRSPSDVADAALALLDAVAVDGRSHGARGGLAFGMVSTRDGDYFGPVVNLAARAAGAAVPGELLADAQAATALGTRARPAGVFDLKGFDGSQHLSTVSREGE